MSTINWLVVLMPVYGERNSLHLVPLLWELEVVKQEIVRSAGDKLTVDASGGNSNSSKTI